MTDEKLFKRALIISLLLHCIMIISLWLSPFSFFNKLPSDQNNISFEVAFVSDINNIKPQIATTKKDVKQEQAREMKKTVKNNKTAALAQNTLNSETIKQPTKNTQKTENTSQKAETIKIDNKKLSTTPHKNTTKTKKVTTPSAKTTPTLHNIDPLDSILKNLEQSTGNNDSKKIHTNATKGNEDMKFFDSDNYNDNMIISVTEKNVIKNAIQRNWNKPTSLPLNNGIKVLFKIEFEKNGIIKNSSHLKTICNHSDDICKIAIESVRRAINSTKIIEGLPPERYDLWKVVELHFDLELI
ncbi:MAG: cell envelope integrity protein TolA [Rickettsiaceae bacterium]|nr:cell envelope integrity protein TolA [Rickettsiaceae bacterium]